MHNLVQSLAASDCKRLLSNCLSVANRSLSVATTDRKSAVISFLIENGEAKVSDFINLIGLSDGRVRVLLREMVNDGTIEKIGNNRYAYYILKQ